MRPCAEFNAQQVLARVPRQFICTILLFLCLWFVLRASKFMAFRRITYRRNYDKTSTPNILDLQ